MRTVNFTKSLTAIAALAAFAGCSSWHQMDKTEGTVAGGASGAVAGAVVAGPVGAVVGGVGGAYTGREVAGKDDRPATTTTYSSTPAPGYNAAMVRDVQQALNAKGYNAGPADGQFGPSTRDALRRFQQTSGLPQTGEPDGQTLSALGVRS